MPHAALFAATRSEAPGGWTIHRLTLRPQRRSGGAARPLFEPPTDVYETADSVVVRMEIAGLTPEELQVSLNADGTLLTVAGYRPNPAAGTPRKYYTMEIECGDFSRQVAIPRPVSADDVTASYSEGFLQVVLPKRGPQPARPRNVPVE